MRKWKNIFGKSDTGNYNKTDRSSLRVSLDLQPVEPWLKLQLTVWRFWKVDRMWATVCYSSAHMPAAGLQPILKNKKVVSIQVVKN